MKNPYRYAQNGIEETATLLHPTATHSGRRS